MGNHDQRLQYKSVNSMQMINCHSNVNNDTQIIYSGNIRFARNSEVNSSELKNIKEVFPTYYIYMLPIHNNDHIKQSQYNVLLNL